MKITLGEIKQVVKEVLGENTRSTAAVDSEKLSAMKPYTNVSVVGLYTYDDGTEEVHEMRAFCTGLDENGDPTFRVVDVHGNVVDQHGDMNDMSFGELMSYLENFDDWSIVG